MGETHCKRICLWSGPRNVSTALMYAFDQRADTTCLDEPLYGHYLRASGAPHPGAPDVIADMEADGEKVIREQVLGPVATPVLFCKMMAHHLFDLDEAFLARTYNVILTRQPREVLATLSIQIPDTRMRDAGYDQQVRLLREYPATPVLDARELLLNPERVLTRLCEQLDLPFDPGMLSWPAGPKACDGVWAPHWYHNVHRSTGFAPYAPSTKVMPDHLGPLLAHCQPLYETLSAAAIRAET
ncbi:MAG: sulfotransferase family protein [Pseudomonadota bacterium]